MKYIKSPIFYMGNKYELLHNLMMYFPKEEEVNLFIDLFGGSGVVSVNVPYKNVVYNELNHNITKILKLFVNLNSEKIIEHIENIIDKFNLSSGNEKEYYNFRKHYNEQKEKNILDLYALTYHSFSNLIRFNSKNEFNMPNGKRTYNENHKINIELFCKEIKSKDIEILNQDALSYLENIKSNVGQFIYLDPPYLNTMAIYNEDRAFGGWKLKHDLKMFNELDRLHKLGIKWAVSNVLVNKGKENKHLKEWAIKNKYIIIDFENKQYSALGKGNAQTQEVLIINYKPPFERFNIFDFMEETQ